MDSMRNAVWILLLAIGCAPGGYYAAQPAAPAVPTCTGGAVPSGDQCVCPDGTSWDGAQCVGASQPQEQEQEQEQQQAATCSGGAVPSGDQCVCPGGTAWDGAQCVNASPQPAPNVEIHVEEHRSTDEIGKSCTSNPGYPSAGSCQYGAVCFRGTCTVWCANDGSCPSGMTCGLTGSPENTQLCQR
jgi:hypothetical protein